MSKIKTLKIILYLGAIYYIIGAVAHYFALTIFPWFDAGLYTSYQDTVIAFVAMVFAYLLVIVAQDPIKNKDVLRAIIISATAASVFSVAIIWKVDFAAGGAPGKELQTIIEGALGFIWVGFVIVFYPRNI